VQPVIAVMAIENKTSDPELASADVGRILSDAFVQLLYDYKGVQVVSPLRMGSIIATMNRTFTDTSRDSKLVHEVSKLAEANTILSGSLSQIGQTYILTATLTGLSGENLLGSFRAESQGKEKLLESLTAGITPQLRNSYPNFWKTNSRRGRCWTSSNEFF
jgi:TolB-like protein